LKGKFKPITLIVVALFFLAVFYYLTKPSRWELYFKNKLNEPVREFVVDAIQKISNNNGTDKIALDLGAGVGHETLLLLERGYNVIAIDGQKEAFHFMLQRPEIKKYQAHLKTVVSTFENLDFALLPDVDLVVASFSLAFCKPTYFDTFWNNVTRKIKSGGYFVGNTFDPGFTAINKKDRPGMTFHTKAQTEALFKDFKIISLNEVQKEGKVAGACDYYYQVVAQKL
jgi:tellurite methyltransferase